MPRKSLIDVGAYIRAPGTSPKTAAMFPSDRVVFEWHNQINFRMPGGDFPPSISDPSEFDHDFDIELPRTGIVHRLSDESGVSGTGVVADFAEFPSGRVVIEWRNDQNPNLEFDDTGIDIRPSMDAAVGIHGHHGRTEFIYDDTGEVAPAP